MQVTGVTMAPGVIMVILTMDTIIMAIIITTDTDAGITHMAITRLTIAEEGITIEMI
jgi:hypothetical protein